MAAKKNKPKPIQFQIGWPGLIAIVISTVCVLLWTFVLGFWMGQKVFTGCDSSKVKTTVVNPRVQATKVPAGQAEEPGSLLYGNETSLFEQNERAIADLKEKLKQEEQPSEKDESIPSEVIGTSGKEQQTGKGNRVSGSKPGDAGEKKKAEKVSKKTGSRLSVEKVGSEKSKKPGQYFALQIASYRARTQAEKETARWEKKGYRVHVKKADLGRKGVWYRVLIGRYGSLEKAKKAAARLASKEGVRSYVVKGGR